MILWIFDVVFIFFDYFVVVLGVFLVLLVVVGLFVFFYMVGVVCMWMYG